MPIMYKPQRKHKIRNGWEVLWIVTMVIDFYNYGAKNYKAEVHWLDDIIYCNVIYEIIPIF